jgi:hypothetical protein
MVIVIRTTILLIVLMLLNKFSAIAQPEKKLMFVAEEQGLKLYIHPETIKRNKPTVRFWIYAISPDYVRVNRSSDVYMVMDCGAEIFRVLQIVRYNQKGDVIENEELTLEEPPQFLGMLGRNISKALVKSVCK